jgi:Response regulator of the LytR/AlgR family
MKVSVICSENIRVLIEDFLKTRHIIIADDADIAVVEKGFALAVGKTSICFDMAAMDSFIYLLDRLSPKETEQQDIIAVRSDKGEYKIIRYVDILYFEALGKHVLCHDNDGRYTVKEKIFTLEEKLGNRGFVRVSKSFIVNITAIDRIVPWFNSTLLLKIGKNQPDITVTRSYINGFKEYLNL